MNYLATAGITVLIILVYYLVIHQPAHDPFGDDDQSPSSSRRFRPNPVDEILLGWLRRPLNHVLESYRMSPRVRSRLEKTFIKVGYYYISLIDILSSTITNTHKCFLAMSDLQIVTGLSILISGLIHFRCGLASFYWEVIVRLAWFSSLTHLSCLTLLRSHLYKHATERKWRLFSMAMLATLLVVGLIFTANYKWVIHLRNHPNANYPAICYLRATLRGHRSEQPFLTMMVSIMLILIGFASRVVKLHRKLSIDIFGRARAWLSDRIRQLLHTVFTWCCRDCSPRSLKRTLCYHPLLAIFLTARFLLDGWASVYFEVRASSTYLSRVSDLDIGELVDFRFRLGHFASASSTPTTINLRGSITIFSEHFPCL